MELLSLTDTLTATQTKMQEYLNSGSRLGWLLDPEDRQVEIYRQDNPLKCSRLPTLPAAKPSYPDSPLTWAGFGCKRSTSYSQLPKGNWHDQSNSSQKIKEKLLQLHPQRRNEATQYH